MGITALAPDGNEVKLSSMDVRVGKTAGWSISWVDASGFLLFDYTITEVPEHDKNEKPAIICDSAINIAICSYSDISNDVRRN